MKFLDSQENFRNFQHSLMLDRGKLRVSLKLKTRKDPYRSGRVIFLKQMDAAEMFHLYVAKRKNCYGRSVTLSKQASPAGALKRGH